MSKPNLHTPTLMLLPDGQAPQLLFLLFHGLGRDGSQMAPLAQALRAQYPQAAVLSIDAPERFDGAADGETGYQWFSLQRIDDASRIERVAAALPSFIASVRHWAAHFELPWERVALGGFSQGAIMALEAVQVEPRLAGRVLAFGGRYARLPQHVPEEVSLHLLHGMADERMPYRDIVQAAQILVQLGADVTADVKPGIGHELHPELIAKAMEQLRTFVPARLWREAVLAAAEQDRQQQG
ncbi:esterase [Paucibacter sp. PLA-PC-4]|uniref:esterase n=1 Tax=Paucibacter sp. PLA-PC-4 TaxID=2993655 RepID=UPI00224B8257|nr:esterase [Paucibacter sp. PLA-PC-4]MCX2864044.1 esterase [Paucibacter sp. PLA-PC-4]